MKKAANFVIYVALVFFIFVLLCTLNYDEHTRESLESGRLEIPTELNPIGLFIPQQGFDCFKEYRADDQITEVSLEEFKKLIGKEEVPLLRVTISSYVPHNFKWKADYYLNVGKIYHATATGNFPDYKSRESDDPMYDRYSSEKKPTIEHSHEKNQWWIKSHREPIHSLTVIHELFHITWISIVILLVFLIYFKWQDLRLEKDNEPIARPNEKKRIINPFPSHLTALEKQNELLKRIRSINPPIDRPELIRNKIAIVFSDPIEIEVLADLVGHILGGNVKKNLDEKYEVFYNNTLICTVSTWQNGSMQECTIRKRERTKERLACLLKALHEQHATASNNQEVKKYIV